MYNSGMKIFEFAQVLRKFEWPFVRRLHINDHHGRIDKNWLNKLVIKTSPLSASTK